MKRALITLAMLVPVVDAGPAWSNPKLPLGVDELLPRTALATTWRCVAEKPSTFRATVTFGVQLDRWVVMTTKTTTDVSIAYSTIVDGTLHRYTIDRDGGFVDYIGDGVDCRGAGHGCHDRIVAWESADGTQRSVEQYTNDKLERITSMRSDDGGTTWTTVYSAACRKR